MARNTALLTVNRLVLLLSGAFAATGFINKNQACRAKYEVKICYILADKQLLFLFGLLAARFKICIPI